MQPQFWSSLSRMPEFSAGLVSGLLATGNAVEYLCLNGASKSLASSSMPMTGWPWSGARTLEQLKRRLTAVSDCAADTTPGLQLKSQIFYPYQANATHSTDVVAAGCVHQQQFAHRVHRPPHLRSGGFLSSSSSLASFRYHQQGGHDHNVLHLLSARAVCRALMTSRAILDIPNRPPQSKADLSHQHQQSTHKSHGGSQHANTGDTDNMPHAKPRAAADAVYNLPNAVSAARLVSGPVIGYWLLQGHYEVATIALVVSGASDWLDGFLARRMGASSVFGSYLDPLADKVLIGCVAAALLVNGAMPGWLAVVVVGRDVLLVSGAFIFRLRGFGWRWPGREAFFRTADQPQPRPLSGVPEGNTSAADAGDAAGATVSGRTLDGGGGEGVAFMRPLLISKANTVLQLVLLGTYLTRGMYGWPDGDPVTALELATAGTTIASLAVYGTNAVQGKLFK